jgi:Flp pilus assembly protein TadD
MTSLLDCENCGASCHPTDTVCRFCKSPVQFSSKQKSESADGGSTDPSLDAALAGILHMYHEGKVEKALTLLSVIAKQHPQADRHVPFLVLQAKLLIETEGITARIKASLSKAYLLTPKHPEVTEYLEMIEGKEMLDLHNEQQGLTMLRAVLQKSPKNPHVLFLLGSYLFWTKNNFDEPMRLLEKCVMNRPNFLRAWACLGAVYKKMGRDSLAEKSFKKCLELESHPHMIAFFKSQLQKTG